jgi:hypothetical protein
MSCVPFFEGVDMRTAAYVILLSTLAIVIDFTQHSADRVLDVSRKRMDDQVRRAVEDWSIVSYLSIVLIGSGLLWSGLVDLPPNTSSLRAKRGAGRGGVIGAVILGSVSSFGVGTWYLASGAIAGLDIHEFEARWVVGAVFGGALGMVFGTIIGAVRRPVRKDLHIASNTLPGN